MDSSDDDTYLRKKVRNIKLNKDSQSDNDSSEDEDDGKPLQVVTFKKSDDSEESLKLVLHEKNLNKIIDSCGNHPISVICIAGPKQTGKSFLLNCIKEKLKSLEDGDGTINCASFKGFKFQADYFGVTSGIWMWSKPFVVDGEDGETAVLLMDTQGIDDEQSKPEDIAAFVGISLLSSSTFILNTCGDLHRPIFDTLQLFTGSSRKSQNLPKLSLAVRDWGKTTICRYGEKGGQKLLAQFLDENSSKCRKVVNAFGDVDCFLLPHVGEQAILENYSGKMSELSKDFLKQMKSYANALAGDGNIKAKSLLGCELAATEFKILFAEFVNFFNTSDEIDIASTPEKITNLIIQSIGKIKIDRGLEAYNRALTSKRKSSLRGGLHEVTVDSLHQQAKRRALQAFKQFELPTKDEKYFQEQFEKKLNEVNESTKLERKAAKTAKINKQVEIACNRLKEELQDHFSFVCKDNSKVSANCIFYDVSHLRNVVDVSRELVANQFFAEFPDDDDEELAALRQTLDTKLQAIEDELYEKNSKNQKRAETNAASVVDKLFDEYVAAMNKRVKRLKRLDEDTLCAFHDGEMEKIENKFEQISLGTKEFCEHWMNELVDKIDAQLETMKLELESTMAEAVNLIKKVSQEYENELKLTVEGLDEEKLLSHHQERSEACLRKFSTMNPYPTSSPKHDEIETKLKIRLQEVYNTVVEEGILVQKKREEKLIAVRKSVVKTIKEELENSVKNTDFLMEDKSNTLAKSSMSKALNSFDVKTVSLGADADRIREEREQLEDQIKAYQETWLIKDAKARKLATAEAEKTTILCTESYETKMTKLLKHIQTNEELVQEHKNTKSAAVNQFKKNVQFKNTTFLANVLKQLETKLDETFAELEDHFKIIKSNYDIGLKTARFDAISYYQDDMEKRFKNNKNGYFDDENLKKISKEIEQESLKKVYRDHKLTDSQKNDIKKELNRHFEKFKDKNTVIRNSYNENEEVAIGIDLGTTYCCVAAYHMGDVRIIRNLLGHNITPSYVQIHPDGPNVVGNAAKTNAFQNPEATIFDAKRMIGRRLDDSKLQEDMKFWPFTVKEVEGKAQILVHGKHYLPEQISSIILKHLKDEAKDILGVEITKAVITVPAYFTDGQRQATIDAGEIAGLKVLGILNEPTAAALAYRLEWPTHGKSRNVLVYDLGGGTFDVAILRISDSKLDVLTINGDSHLGGEDFDQNLMKHCADKFKAETEIDLFDGLDSDKKTEVDNARRCIKRLQLNCEEAKKQLATARTTTISVDEIVRGSDLSVEVKLKEFEDMNMPLFKKTIDIVASAITSAKLQKQDIDDIVLVGGSTRIKKVQELLQKFFSGKTLNKHVNPDEAVAYGAAVQAASLNAKPGSKIFDFGTIQEVTPMSLGIEVATGEVDVIIPKNTKMPTKMNQVYRTFKPDQTSVVIPIYQGEEKLAKENKLLGTFVLSGIPPGPAGKECVDVTMNIDINGILSVEAVCRSTKERKSITVSEEKGRLTQEQKRTLRDEM